MSTWKTVVVGVDGSPGSRKALVWGAAEAASHGAKLVALNVWERTLPAPGASVSAPEHGLADTGHLSAEDLVKEIKDALGDTPPLVVQPSVKEGNAAKVLIEHSSKADLLVVGTRGRGGFRGLVLGSVSQHVAGYARCSVTVVR